MVELFNWFMNCSWWQAMLVILIVFTLIHEALTEGN